MLVFVVIHGNIRGSSMTQVERKSFLQFPGKSLNSLKYARVHCRWSQRGRWNLMHRAGCCSFDQQERWRLHYQMYSNRFLHYTSWQCIDRGRGRATAPEVADSIPIKLSYRKPHVTEAAEFPMLGFRWLNTNSNWLLWNNLSFVKQPLSF